MLARNLLQLSSVFGAVLNALSGFLVKRALSVPGSAVGPSPEGPAIVLIYFCMSGMHICLVGPAATLCAHPLPSTGFPYDFFVSH
jgi:hypothetical protein